MQTAPPSMQPKSRLFCTLEHRCLWVDFGSKGRLHNSLSAWGCQPTPGRANCRLICMGPLPSTLYLSVEESEEGKLTIYLFPRISKRKYHSSELLPKGTHGSYLCSEHPPPSQANTWRRLPGRRMSSTRPAPARRARPRRPSFLRRTLLHTATRCAHTKAIDRPEFLCSITDSTPLTRIRDPKSCSPRCGCSLLVRLHGDTRC